jgi:hypothetical protein
VRRRSPTTISVAPRRDVSTTAPGQHPAEAAISGDIREHWPRREQQLPGLAKIGEVFLLTARNQIVFRSKKSGAVGCTAARSPRREVIDRRERCGPAFWRASAGPRPQAQVAPAPRSHATTTLPFWNPAVHRPFGLVGATSDLLVPWSPHELSLAGTPATQLQLQLPLTRGPVGPDASRP